MIRPENRPGDACTPPRHPYSVLLPVGFTLPLPLLVARWALTPPFHPCRTLRARRFVFCCTFPGVAPAGCYPAPCFHGARTFLPSLSFDIAKGDRPASWPGDVSDWMQGGQQNLQQHPYAEVLIVKFSGHQSEFRRQVYLIRFTSLSTFTRSRSPAPDASAFLPCCNSVH